MAILFILPNPPFPLVFFLISYSWAKQEMNVISILYFNECLEIFNGTDSP